MMTESISTESPSMITRRWIINGEERTLRFSPLTRLLDLLREEEGLNSLKEGCGEGECGACSVMIDNQVRLTCLIMAAQLDHGARILTAEGLTHNELGDRLQRAFGEGGAVQCGYCTPGVLIGSYALLQANPAPSPEQVRAALAGNLCRCTGYTKILEAVTVATAVEEVTGAAAAADKVKEHTP